MGQIRIIQGAKVKVNPMVEKIPHRHKKRPRSPDHPTTDAKWHTLALRLSRSFECQICSERKMIATDRARVYHDDEHSTCDNDMCWDCLGQASLIGMIRMGPKFTCGVECAWCRQSAHFDLGNRAPPQVLHAAIRYLYPKSIKLDLMAEIVNGNLSLVEESESDDEHLDTPETD